MTRDPDDPRDWCARCGARLPIDKMWGWRRYCSPRCRDAHAWDLEREAREAAKAGRRCVGCGEPIPPERYRNATYCSRRCMEKHKARRLRARARGRRST